MKNKLTKIFMLICTFILLLCFSLGVVACNEPEKEGKFYSLEKAYEDGLITREDLLNIAYYHGDAEHNPDELNDSFIPKELGELDEQTSLKIRTDLAELFNEMDSSTEKVYADNFEITNYLGTYNGCVVFYYEADFLDFDTVIAQREEKNIDGVIISYTSYVSLNIWTHVKQ